MPGDFFGLSGHVIDGQFHVLEVAGEGGFSVVYRGQHLTLREPVAVKCLKFQHKSDAVIASFTQRFFDESRIMYRLSQGNLNIVRAITTGVTVAPSTGATVPYMVLEWLDGVPLSKTLRELRAKKGPGLSLGKAMEMFEPAALAIAYAHSQGVVHRDIKPGNLFMQKASSHASAHGSGVDTMKVLDFGMAKVLTPEAMGGLESAQTLGGVVVLSPQYVTPEQLDKSFGAIGAWTDVYSFALIMIEALTAKRARDAETFADLMVQITKEKNAPTPRRRGASHISFTVDRVFERALARDVKARTRDLGTFWRELKDAVNEDEAEDHTHVDVPPPASAMGATAIMASPRAEPSQPNRADFSKTMPLQALEPRTSAPPTPRVDPPRQSQPVLRAEASGNFAPVAVPPQTATPPQTPSPPLALPRPPEPEPEPVSTLRPKPRTSRVLIAFLLLFVAVSLGASGLLFFRILRS